MKIPFEKNIQSFAYFITIRTYATWLHGDQRGSTDLKHNRFNYPNRPPETRLQETMKSVMQEPIFLLNSKDLRETVLRSIIETARCLQWKLFAVHVRSNHLHIIVKSNRSKEKTMGAFKQYATKALKKSHENLCVRRNFWAFHGSTKNIWTPEDLMPVLYYVIKEQGIPMSLYYDKDSYSIDDEMLYQLYRGL